MKMSNENGHNHKESEDELDSIIENQLMNKNEKLLSVSDHLVKFISKRLKDMNEREMKTNPKVYRCFHCLEFIQTILVAFVLTIKKVLTSTSHASGCAHEVEALKQVYLLTMLILLQMTRCTCNIIMFMNVCQQKKWTEQASYDSNTLVIKLEDCYRYLEKRISKLERLLQDAAELGRIVGGQHKSSSRTNEMDNDTSRFLCVVDQLKTVKLNVADCEERIWITCDRISITLREIIKRRMLIRWMGGVISVIGGLTCSTFVIPSTDADYLRLCYSIGLIVGFLLVVNIIGTVLFKHPGKVPKDFDKYNTERLKSTKEVDDFIISWEKFCGESLM